MKTRGKPKYADGKLSLTQLRALVADARAGSADPPHVKWLLQALAQIEDFPSSTQIVLLGYMREAMRAYVSKGRVINGKRRAIKTLDEAFGVALAQGRPPVTLDEDRRVLVASMMVRLRVIKRLSHRDALQVTGDEMGMGRTAVAQAFNQFRLEGVALLRNSLSRAWTREEQQRLAAILEDGNLKSAALIKDAPPN